MSGFVALYRPGETVEESELERLTATLAHRGPGRPTRWRERSVGLGHQHLETTPEARYERLPYVDERLALTADVRLDNRGALLERLSLSGDPARIPDGEVLAAAYRRWGRRCPEHLVGAFAFAIWDREREWLFCARDQLGIKPCYLHRSPGVVAAATTLPTLLEVAGLEATLDERAVGDYLAGRFADRERTVFAEGGRLPPGHSLTVTADTCERHRYWSLADVDPLPRRSRGYYERRFRDLFEAAVTARVRTAGPVGSFLSGGIDSSSITALAGRLHERPIHAVSAVFEEVTACDERAFVDAVLETGAFRHHTVAGDRVPPLSALEDLLEHHGRPYYPSLCMLVPRLYETAAGAGASVVLHGYGGDQTMGSDPRGYFRDLARRGRLLALRRELRGYCRRNPWLEPRAVLYHDVCRPLAPTPVRRAYHARFEPGHYTDATLAPIEPAFALESGLEGRLRRDALTPEPRTQAALRRRALSRDEPAFNLELNDAMAAAVGVEPRYPYFDVRLVEFAAALPAGTTVSAGRDRTVVRDALADVLPRAVRERDDKTEFSPNVLRTTRRYERERIETTLFESTPRTDPYLDFAALERAFARLERGDASVSDARGLLMATTLERWCERYGPETTV
ncbi:asparagine synthase-related protein [Natronobiforma cellulositropha]|uniref:asparagine synthase-related protein n=1 Tax=Natronobiforma cellulositropha TaxID=1679076 RepID=UPI0021D5903E|nr:asparagine synthase-related protein [Natronobiforma cellulositropha]